MKRIINKVSKMPCYSFNHGKCITGSKLRSNKNSVCSNCYACKGFYVFHKDKHAAKTAILNDLASFEHDLIADIRENEKSGYFRYHDKGDIVSIDHLHAICNIARSLPHIKFWLPTKEYSIVREYLKSGNKIPENLCIRLSKYLVNLDKGLDKVLNELPYSTVYDKTIKPKYSFICKPVNSKCGNCRACWNKEIRNVTYIKH